MQTVRVPTVVFLVPGFQLNVGCFPIGFRACDVVRRQHSGFHPEGLRDTGCLEFAGHKLFQKHSYHDNHNEICCHLFCISSHRFYQDGTCLCHGIYQWNSICTSIVLHTYSWHQRRLTLLKVWMAYSLCIPLSHLFQH